MPHISFRIVIIWWSAFYSISSLFPKCTVQYVKWMVLKHMAQIIIPLLLVSMNFLHARWTVGGIIHNRVWHLSICWLGIHPGLWEICVSWRVAGYFFYPYSLPLHLWGFLTFYSNWCCHCLIFDVSKGSRYFFVESQSFLYNYSQQQYGLSCSLISPKTKLIHKEKAVTCATRVPKKFHKAYIFHMILAKQNIIGWLCV